MHPAIATTQTVFNRRIQRNQPVFGAALGAGLGLVLYCGGAADLAASALAIIAIASYVTGFLRFHWRGMLDWARANITLVVASVLTTVPRLAAVSQFLLFFLLAVWRHLKSRATTLRSARVGHRRIAHIALTARVVPAPIARA